MQLPCVWDAPRPFVHPLTTPAGAILSVEAPADHPWHHALWFTIKYVNGENFWEEYGEFGLLRTTSVREDAGASTATLEWVAPDGESVRLRETRTLRATEIDTDSYAIDWTEELTVPVDTVLDRTPFTTWGGYGGLTLRGAPTWTDTVLRLDDGADRERTLGDRSTWLAIDGRVASSTPEPERQRRRAAAQRASVGTTAQRSERSRRSDGVAEMTAGVVILDHPDNVRAPSPWYGSTKADTYGEGWANFVNAAFLWDEPLPLAAGETLALRYRVLVHDGVWDRDRIEAEAERWTR